MSGFNWFGPSLMVGAMALFACGDDTGGGSGGAGSGSGGAGSGGDASSTTHGSGGSMGETTSGSSGATTGTTTGTGEVAPAAPVLDEVMPMHGALHLYWTNVADDCDEVEGERMTPDDDFTVFFTVPGTVDNEADDGAIDPATTYTYRVRCKRGETYSEYSNELSASPE